MGDFKVMTDEEQLDLLNENALLVVKVKWYFFFLQSCIKSYFFYHTSRYTIELELKYHENFC